MYNSVLLFMNIGGPEMILIFLVVLLLFGGKKLPELARGLGKGLREFKDASDGIKREIHNNINTVSEAAADMDKVTVATETSVAPVIRETDVSPETYKHDSEPETPETVIPQTEVPEAVSTEQTKSHIN
jgi:sec-independent protein translocase protein TatA